MSSPKRILWSANDPGGMNAIAPVIEALIARGDEVVGIATGPALTVAHQKKFPLTESPPASVQLLLAGTSFGDSVDKQIRAVLSDIPSVYVLDYWGNYALRFSTEGAALRYLPTKLCVMDATAQAGAVREGIPEDRIVITGNPYFEHFTDNVTQDAEDPHEILFISQPIRKDVGRIYGFDEYTVLESLKRVVERSEGYRLVLKLHPRDEAGKYDAYLSDRVSISREKSLEAALSKAGTVVVMYSIVLMQAALAGKKVLSYQPGLIGEDLLPTNALGVTQKISHERELEVALRTPRPAPAPAALWPKGATNRILQVIDSLI